MRTRPRFIFLTGILSFFFASSVLAAEPLTGAIKPKIIPDDSMTDAQTSSPEPILPKEPRTQTDRQRKQSDDSQHQRTQQQPRIRTVTNPPTEIRLRNRDRQNEQFDDDRNDWEFRTFEHRHRPRYYQEMPYGYRSFFLGGLHYFFYDELWYVMRNGYYEEVTAPHGIIIINGEPVLNSQPILTPTPTYNEAQPVGDMQVIDFNGLRYYYKDGRYYRRDINGMYLEVPPPQ